ncbi:MAG TPA: tetratricopeptide repeat protein [Flavobacteriales bacterium]|nr:tetratricopeptide repeat protein [Flavobacteriales bacterium]
MNKIFMTALRKSLLFIPLIVLSTVIVAQNVGPNLRKAEIRFKMKDYKGAIEYYTKELADKPENLNAYYRRGFTYGRQGNHKAAIRDYSIIVKKDPEHVWAYISRGSSRNQLKLFEEAIADFDKAIEIAPKNQEAYNNRGWAKHGLGDKKGACKDWKYSKKMGNGEAKIILSNTHCK